MKIRAARLARIAALEDVEAAKQRLVDATTEWSELANGFTTDRLLNECRRYKTAVRVFKRAVAKENGWTPR